MINFIDLLNEVRSKYRVVMIDVESTPERARAIGMSKEDFNKMATSIKKNGVVKPIIIDKESGQVLDGHHRLFVSEELGIKKIPAIYINKNDYTREEFEDLIKRLPNV